MRSTTVALVSRLLWAGMDPKTVAARTGVDVEDVLELQKEMP